MLTARPSSPAQKLRFLLVLPLAAAVWVGVALLAPRPAAGASGQLAPRRIGTITWQGNTFLTTAQLNEALGLKPGDPYETRTLEAYLANRENQQDVTSRYLNQGYLFFSIVPVAKARPDGTTDLTFNLTEGPTVRINHLTVSGNYTVTTSDILKLVSLRAGELFSREKLVQSQRALAASGLFDPTKIGINPRPNPTTGLVDIEFTVVEK